jgi:chemotaxis signal transduction protein
MSAFSLTKPTPAVSGGIESAPLLGIASVQDEGFERLLLLIDIQRLLAQADLGLSA